MAYAIFEVNSHRFRPSEGDTIMASIGEFYSREKIVIQKFRHRKKRWAPSWDGRPKKDSAALYVA